AGYRPDATRGSRRRHQRMIRQIRREMFADGDRTDTRAAATVRDAKRLVEVEMGDVGAEATRSRKPDQGVEVRAVDVDLAAGVVDGRADLGDIRLEDAMR